MIRRAVQLRRVRQALSRAPIASILGPRQSGKTTLARAFAGRRAAWFDLENPVDLARLAAPMSALDPLRGLVVIDEIQRLPRLFVVHPGKSSWPMDERVESVSILDLPERLAKLG